MEPLVSYRLDQSIATITLDDGKVNALSPAMQSQIPHEKLSRLYAYDMLGSLALTARTVNDLGIDRWRLNAEQRALRALVARVPARVPISVNERLIPHLAERHETAAAQQSDHP